jgi:hypothetical protein
MAAAGDSLAGSKAGGTQISKMVGPLTPGSWDSVGSGVAVVGVAVLPAVLPEALPEALSGEGATMDGSALQPARLRINKMEKRRDIGIAFSRTCGKKVAWVATSLATRSAGLFNPGYRAADQF